MCRRLNIPPIWCTSWCPAGDPDSASRPKAASPSSVVWGSSSPPPAKEHLWAPCRAETQGCSTSVPPFSAAESTPAPAAKAVDGDGGLWAPQWWPGPGAGIQRRRAEGSLFIHPSAHPTVGIQQDFPSAQRLPVYFGRETQTAPLFCCEVWVINSRWSGTLLGYFGPPLDKGGKAPRGRWNY